MRGAHTENTEDEMEKTSSTRALNSRRLAVVTFMATIVLIRLPGAAAKPKFACPIENRMSEEMLFECDDEVPTPLTFSSGFTVRRGETVWQSYRSTSDPKKSKGYTGRVTCVWSYAGNTMSGVVKWDERWPEAPSCLHDAEPGCKLVFENKEVTIVSAAGGRRVLGDLAVKECSKNWNGWGGWLPFGLGCTYPNHDHPYVGTIVS